MSKQFKTRKLQGFTLVELSIVIVIIGFLVAGIAAGSSMIKQAQIRSVISDISSYQTAMNGFKARFFNKVPGDMDTAESFWGAGICSDSTDFCNGNGNGIINKDTSSTGIDETRPALKQLALAGLISAGIPVVPNTIVALQPGVNAPASKVSGVGYYLIGNPQGTANVLIIGKPTTALTAGDDLINSAFTPEDAFNIDQKLDDAIVVGSLDNPLGFFINSASAVSDPSTILGTVYPGATVGSGSGACSNNTTGPLLFIGGGREEKLDVLDAAASLTEATPNLFISSAYAAYAAFRELGGGGTACFAGAYTGTIVVQQGADATAPCVINGSYDFNVTTPTCVMGSKFD